MTVTELPNTAPCPVCESDQLLIPFQRINGVQYQRCTNCQATLMDPAYWPDPEKELAVYQLHDNDAEEPGYQKFLSKVAEPLLEQLEQGMRGLDFGCGPGPALAGMLERAGMDVALYDPWFAPERSVLEARYDFITCTEVVEHLQKPGRVFRQLDQLLKPGGWLAVMTCFQTDDSRFANWHYRRDPTHIVFYREATLAWIAHALGWSLWVPRKDVALFRKPCPSR